MPLRARSNRFTLIVAAAFVVCLFCCASTAIAFRYRFAFLDPLALSNQNAIHQAADALIADVESDNIFAETSEKKLLSLMQKLNSGWPGFRVNGYYPFQYAPEDLLNSVYWDLGQAASRSTGSPRKKLIAVLRAVPPRRQDADAQTYYRKILNQFSLE